MLTRFFKPTIVLANHAESGETFRSSQSAGRFAKVFSQMQPGDFLIMQFGHNDMKSVDEASYAASIREAVAACRAKEGIPIVVSPMERRGFDADGKIRESLHGFPEAARTTAAELDVAFIDLHAMSIVLYEALGPEQSPLAFALANGQRDGTHHNNYGSYQLAKCIVEGIKQVKPDLAGHLIDGLPTYDPAHPDSIEAFSLPPSAQYASAPPDGN
jgi:lysophospholipase L1-like esterase